MTSYDFDEFDVPLMRNYEKTLRSEDKIMVYNETTCQIVEYSKCPTSAEPKDSAITGKTRVGDTHHRLNSDKNF